MRAARAYAHPRVGLLGNPSDQYGGSCLGFAFEDFAVALEVRPAASPELEAWESASVEVAEPATGLAPIRLRANAAGGSGSSAAHSAKRDAVALLTAGWNVFLRAPEARGRIAPDAACDVTFTTDVPRQVGLAGSSAILVALLRALDTAFDVSLTALRSAELALAAEVDELGLRAGPLDRVVQACEGFLALDCAAPFDPQSVTRLDPELLPPLLVAWDPRPGTPSGAVHAPVRARWERGEREVRDVMAALARVSDRGRAALDAGDRAGFRACVDENFDLRARVFAIGERDRRLIAIGRALGAATKFCGSGGAALVVPRAGSDRERIAAAYADAGFQTLRPTIRFPTAGGVARAAALYGPAHPGDASADPGGRPGGRP